MRTDLEQFIIDLVRAFHRQHKVNDKKYKRQRNYCQVGVLNYHVHDLVP